MLCGVAQGQALLVGARFVQGVGGAMTSAVILGMIVSMFPEPGERARAIGVYSFVAAAGGAVGLLAGGVITQAINWHWIFFVNLPIGIVTAFAAWRLLGSEQGIGIGQGADLHQVELALTALRQRGGVRREGERSRRHARGAMSRMAGPGVGGLPRGSRA